LLRTLLDDPQRRFTSGMDGMLAGYVLLQPKEGSAYMTGLMRDAKLDFGLRYAALRASRFIHEFRADLVPAADLTAALVILLDQKDIADLAVEDLRKWGRWEVADAVLGLYGRESHNVPIIRRSVLRYALSCPPGNAKVDAFLAERRKDSAKLVEEVQEILNLEAPKPVAAAPATTAAPKK
jgi:hypothetical protein